MINREFLKAGHLPTLLSAFFYFDMSFMVWVLLGALAVQMSADLGAERRAEGLHGGAAGARRRAAARRVRRAGRPSRPQARRHHRPGHRHRGPARRLARRDRQLSRARSRSGLVLGVAGASFAVALPLASRWYPPQYQGIALGIAGAGNSGTVFAVAVRARPRAGASAGTTCSASPCIPLRVAFLVYLFAAKDSPTAPPPKKLAEYLAVLRMRDAWWFMFFYAVTFGGFVGLASSLAIYFNTDYGLTPVTAGYFTAACVFCRLAGAADRRRARRSHRRHQDAERHVRASRRCALVVVSFRPQSVYAALGAVRRAACSRSAWATARCSSSCRSASATRSA